jgi:uncharacterized protein
MKQPLIHIALLIAFAFPVCSQDIPEKPDPPRLVNDFAGVLTESECSSLETELENYARRTTTQIVIVAVPSLGGYDIADYAFRLGEKWGVGQKGSNNGVVIIYKPKTAEESGRVFVAVGYGLEGVIPDAVANRLIVNNEMLPHFREGDTYGGLLAGCKIIMSLASKEFTAKEYEEKIESGMSDLAALVLIMALIFAIFFFASAARNRNYTMSADKSALPWWIIASMMNQGGKSDGKWDDFNRGGGSFGGSSSGSFGGFGGFGGGSFGGGGAGGSW